MSEENCEYERDFNLPSFESLPYGTVHDIASYIFDRAPYQNETISLAGAIAFGAAIVGRSHNISGAGCNIYGTTVGQTGIGKEQAAEGVDDLLARLERDQPLIGEVRGPAELVSAPGLQKALAARRFPSMLSFVGEVGHKLQLWSSPKRDANAAQMERMLLQLYSKSGHRSVLGDAAYSDRQNNPGALQSPTFSFLGDTTPDMLRHVLTEENIGSGLLPRMLFFTTEARRPYLNRGRAFEPDPSLMAMLKTVTAASFAIQEARSVCNVQLAPDAANTFDLFERHATDWVNSGTEVSRHLWSRAHLKALKLAAILAAMDNPYQPCVSYEQCMWATNLVAQQIGSLAAKFLSGDVGDISGDEVAQQRAVIRVISEYCTSPYSRYASYHPTEEMHAAKVFTLAFLMQRLRSTAPFKRDRIGPAKAIERAVRQLLDADQIREIPRKQMQDSFGRSPRGFCVSDPATFLNPMLPV